MSESADTPTFGTGESTTPHATKYMGRVKWFNNRAGYGFITITEGEDSVNDDLFVHHSAVNVNSEQYKYLVEGEYINFNKIVSDNSEHKFQAGNVTGVNGGQLMCETRNNARVARSDKPGSEQNVRPRVASGGRGGGKGGGKGGGRGMQRVFVRGGGPREGGEEWYLVRRSARRPEQGGRGDRREVAPMPQGTARYPQEFAEEV